MIIRLDKYLADTGFGTRSTVKQLIRKGSVTVDGAAVKSPDVKIDTEKAVVTVNGKTVSYDEFEYYMLNKPAGVISASSDEREKTVVDIISDKKRRDLFPVGRLDRDTVGLLLITNDGALAQKLLAPGKHVEKVYIVRVTGEVTEEDVQAFKEGMDIGDEKLTKPAGLVIKCVIRDEETAASGSSSDSEKFNAVRSTLGEETAVSGGSGKDIEDDGDYSADNNEQPNDRIFTEAEVTLTEGRFHQIKRMFEARGHVVVYLKRISMGTLKLDESLAEGQYRKLTEEEIRNL